MIGSPSQKKQRRSLSFSKRKVSSIERFAACSNEDLEAAAKKTVPKNTVTSVNWEVNTLQDWIVEQSGLDNGAKWSPKCLMSSVL